MAPAATAATGIAGIAFAHLTARQTQVAQAAATADTRRFEHEREVRRERRETFARYLAALDDFSNQIPHAAFALQKHSQSDEAPAPAAAQKLSQLSRVLDGCVLEVILVGTEEVRAAVDDLHLECLELSKATLNDPSKWKFVSRAAREKVLDAMRRDLGYASPSIVETTQSRARRPKLWRRSNDESLA